MKRSHRTFVVLIALSASVVYGELTVNLAGGNGFAFSGTEYASPTAKPGVTRFEVLQNATTFDMDMTTPDDILYIEFTLDVSAGSVYQDCGPNTGCTRNPYGRAIATNTGPPDATLVFSVNETIANNPQVTADSWVTTPAKSTACALVNRACPGFDSGAPAIHFDGPSDGPQTDFNFARITMLPNESGVFAAEFNGSVVVANQPVPLAEPFSFTIRSVVPEPDSFGLLLTASLGGFAMIQKRRDFDWSN